MNSLNILHVTKKYPGALGGDSVVVSNLRAQQEKAGHRVTIFTSNCKEIEDGKHIYKFGLADTPAALDTITLRRLISLVALFFKAFAVCRKERPDVIHTHSVDMAFFVSFAARFYRIPLIHTFHIVTFYDQSQPAVRRKAELVLAKAADLRVVTAPNSHDVARLRRAGLGQTVLLPNGVDLEFWHTDPDVAKRPEFVFISVGRLEAQKGCDYLIKAVALLKSAVEQPFRLIVVGEGTQQDDLQQLASTLDARDVIEFVGRKTPREVRSLLSRADVAVFASLYETTPITLLEAWAVRTPVIMTPVGLLQGATAATRLVWLVRPKSARSLQQAMQRCMRDKQLRVKLAAAGQAEVKKYGWPGIARSAEALYGGVV